MKRKRAMPEKKYFFMLSATKACGLERNWHHLAVYSFLVYRRGQKNQTAKKKIIAQNIRIARESVRESLKALAKHGLVEKLPNGRYGALEPSADTWAWFDSIKTIDTDHWPWWKRFATWPYYVTVNGGMSPMESATLWKIHSWNTGPYDMTVTAQGLATQSLMGLRTVKRHITNLRAKGLLDANLRLTLTDENKNYWQERTLPPKKMVKPEVRQSLRELAASWYRDQPPAIFENAHDLHGKMDFFEEAMKMYGFDQNQINDFWRALALEWLAGDMEHFEVFLIRGFSAVLTRVQQRHEENGYPYPNCLGLLRLVSEGACRDLQSFAARGEPPAAWEARVDKYFGGKASKNGRAEANAG